MSSPYGARWVDAPVFPVVKLRDTVRGIRILSDAGYDVHAYLERYREKQKDRSKRRGKQRERAALSKPFIAWDGEGWTDHDGEHRYMYMANSLGQYIESAQLETTQCLDMLISAGRRHPDAIHVIYGGGYDVTHWLRDMHYMWRDTLVDYGNVTWKGYTIKYVPSKWFTVSRRVETSEGVWETISITIWDVMTFFQSSFIKALESRNLSVPEEITAGKAGRSSFTLDDLEFIHTYTGYELKLLVDLCEQLRAEFVEAEIPLDKYHGPGAVANSVMKLHNIVKHKRLEDEQTELLCMRAYFGGRFEPFRVGHYEGPVYQADIQSAYPHKIAQLPSLDGSTWEYRKDYSPGELGIWRVRYRGSVSKSPHPLPWRAHTGAVGFPQTVESVFVWSFEAATLDPECIVDGWVLRCDEETRPFSFVPDYYATRREWKRVGKGGERALKLALNSLYGKMAQRTGNTLDGPPRYHQLAWAGMVTSATRAQLYGAIQLDPDSVIAVETDSVTTTRRLDGLAYTPELGDWELDEYDWITYLQSGVYWTNQGQNTKIKTRGISAGELNHDQAMDYLSGRAETLTTEVTRFIGITNPQRSHYGQWVTSPRVLALSSGGKRIHVPDMCPECLSGAGLHETLHTMLPNPAFGFGDSKPHPLPWRPDVEANDVFDGGLDDEDVLD